MQQPTVAAALQVFYQRLDQWPLSLRELARQARVAADTVARMQVRRGPFKLDSVLKVERALDDNDAWRQQ